VGYSLSHRMAPLENEKKGRDGLIDDGVPVSKIRIADFGANSQFSRISGASTATTTTVVWCIELRLFPELPQRVNHGST
jgi:hypothetical protein